MSGDRAEERRRRLALLLARSAEQREDLARLATRLERPLMIADAAIAVGRSLRIHRRIASLALMLGRGRLRGLLLVAAHVAVGWQTVRTLRTRLPRRETGRLRPARRRIGRR